MPQGLRLTMPIAVALLAVAMSGCGAGTGETPGPATTRGLAPSERLFAPDSVWNAPLPDDAPVDPSSERLVAALVREVDEEQRRQDGPWIQTTTYSTPIYRVPADQPAVAVTLDNSAPWARTLRMALRSVPIPADARPAAGTDGHMTIWQPSSDRLWELWRARRAPDGWHAAWGGAIRRVSESPGYYTADSWSGARPYWGATASSLPVAGGTITIAELKQGRIDHALAIDVPTARRGVYAFPAQRTDGLDPSPLALPEGARLRIDPRLDVRSLYLPPVTEAIALAAQRYGMIVRDQTHHAIGFYAEDPAPTESDPYPALLQHRYPSILLAGFPWRRVEVLRMDLRRDTGHPR